MSYDVAKSDDALSDAIALITWCLDDAPPQPLIVEGLRSMVKPRDAESQRAWIERLGYSVEALTALATALLEMASEKMGVPPADFLRMVAADHAARVIERGQQ